MPQLRLFWWACLAATISLPALLVGYANAEAYSWLWVALLCGAMFVQSVSVVVLYRQSRKTSDGAEENLNTSMGIGLVVFVLIGNPFVMGVLLFVTAFTAPVLYFFAVIATLGFSAGKTFPNAKPFL